MSYKMNMSVRFLIFLKRNETKLCDFESRAWRHVLDAALCDKDVVFSTPRHERSSNSQLSGDTTTI
jgi:hypothetical protein